MPTMKFSRAAQTGTPMPARSEVELMQRLRKSEETGDWRGPPEARTGLTTFAEVLNRNDAHDDRYRAYCYLSDLLGEDTIQAIGIDSAIAVSVLDDGARLEAVQKMRAYGERNGVPPTKQQAKAIAKL